jgi:hypothetical protein
MAGGGFNKESLRKRCRGSAKQEIPSNFLAKLVYLELRLLLQAPQLLLPVDLSIDGVNLQLCPTREREARDRSPSCGHRHSRPPPAQRHSRGTAPLLDAAFNTTPPANLAGDGATSFVSSKHSRCLSTARARAPRRLRPCGPRSDEARQDQK